MNTEQSPSLTFHSEVPLFSTGPIERLSNRVTAEMRGLLGDSAPPYQASGLSIGHDPLLRKYGRAQFLIQRRAEIPFTDNYYFSEAPLSTETHIALLEQFEKDVAEMLNPRLLGARS